MTRTPHMTIRSKEPRRTPRVVRRAGYTLFELVVVVALVVLVASLSFPYFLTLMADARIEAAGDMIRARMADARSMALEQGRPYRFGFLPGTGKFQVAPDDSSDWDSVQDGEDERDDLIRGQLPEGVIFVTDAGALRSGSAPGQGNGWQLGGVFLPEGGARGATNSDGTSSDDVTFYFGQSGIAPMGMRLRGLTGTLRVFDPDTEGDQP
jgi:type II secretory pathway pseudopilin PulG